MDIEKAFLWHTEMNKSVPKKMKDKLIPTDEVVTGYFKYQIFEHEQEYPRHRLILFKKG